MEDAIKVVFLLYFLELFIFSSEAWTNSMERFLVHISLERLFTLEILSKSTVRVLILLTFDMVLPFSSVAEIIIPVGVGAIAVVLIFSKLMRKIMDIAYATVFHFIFGVVIASTVIIAPDSSLYQGFEIFDYVIVALIFLVGLSLGYWMGQLEEKYK